MIKRKAFLLALSAETVLWFCDYDRASIIVISMLAYLTARYFVKIVAKEMQCEVN